MVPGEPGLDDNFDLAGFGSGRQLLQTRNPFFDGRMSGE